MKIVDITTGLNWSAQEQVQFKALGEFIQVPVIPKTEIELINCLQDADYAILLPLSETNVSSQVFDKTPKLKGISLIATGVDWIDIDAAKTLGIIISNSNNYSTISVAEFAIALIFSLIRKVVISTTKIQDKKFYFEDFIGFELKDKVLGVVGMGSIGSYIAQLGQGLGMHVIGYNRTFKNSLIPLVTIEELLQKSDIIILSLALNKCTENFLNMNKLSLLKSTSVIINISREGLIDQEAIYQALIANKIAGYAFELDEPRKFPIKEELLKLNNVIATPHTAWYTSEALTRLKQITMANIHGMINGEPINTV